jgi:hypothetical protein
MAPPVNRQGALKKPIEAIRASAGR